MRRWRRRLSTAGKCFISAKNEETFPQCDFFLCQLVQTMGQTLSHSLFSHFIILLCIFQQGAVVTEHLEGVEKKAIFASGPVLHASFVAVTLSEGKIHRGSYLRESCRLTKSFAAQCHCSMLTRFCRIERNDPCV